MIRVLKMHKVIVGMVALAGVAQGFEIQEAEVNTERCGPGLELRGPDGALLSGTAVTGHDYDGTAGTDNSAMWSTLIQQYGMGIKFACQRYNTELNKISDGMRLQGADAEYWVEKPDEWAPYITKALHKSGCAISEDDKNLQDMVKTMVYIHQQKKRMSKAQSERDNYMEKLEALQNEWRVTRDALKDVMNAHADVLKTRLDRAAEYESEKKYSQASRQLLGGSNSAKTIIGGLKGDLSAAAAEFETLAHQVKRDGLRWSVLNQIANEGERLEVFARSIERAAYDVLSTCIVNYQKEAEAR